MNDLGNIIKIYTPAENKRDWIENYCDRREIENPDDLPDAMFIYNWAIGEIVYEHGERLTHDHKIEKPQAELAEAWQVVA